MFYRFFRPRRAAFLRWTLLSVELWGELISGFPVVGLPLLRDQLGLSYEQVGLLFSVGALTAMILEPIMNLLSDRGSKRWWVIGGLLGLAIGFALMGTVHTFGLLLLAFALSQPADDAAVGLAQAALIDFAPKQSARTMTHWTLMGSVGDLLSPLAVTTLVAFQLGWSALCWLATALWLALALVVILQRFPRSTDTANTDDKPPSTTIWQNLREALSDRVLLRWGAISLVTSMLDEVFLGFAGLYLRDVLHASKTAVGLVLAVGMVGTLLSLLLLSLALFVIGFGAASWYPIAKAAAYTRHPGRSGTVRAVIGLGAPFEVALPGIVGFVAGRFGILAGIGLLGLAPLFVLLLVPKK